MREVKRIKDEEGGGLGEDGGSSCCCISGGLEVNARSGREHLFISHISPGLVCHEVPLVTPLMLAPLKRGRTARLCQRMADGRSSIEHPGTDGRFWTLGLLRTAA